MGLPHRQSFLRIISGIHEGGRSRVNYSSGSENDYEDSEVESRVGGISQKPVKINVADIEAFKRIHTLIEEEQTRAAVGLGPLIDKMSTETDGQQTKGYFQCPRCSQSRTSRSLLK